MAQASKTKSIFVCSNCGNEFLAWQGQCSGCGEWNTIKEIQNSKFKIQSGRRSLSPFSKFVLLKEVKLDEVERIATGFAEFDRVLGGGIVPGSIGLIGGDPGIGKSTLLLQIAHQISNVLYVSGEESAEQIALRVKRLGLSGDIRFLAETNFDGVLSVINETAPKLVIIDSIQTMYDKDFPSTPGSIVQVRETAWRFQQLAKQSTLAMMLVGHVTKEGTVAGPRTLEHMIDYLVYLEGESRPGLRILRGVKNRFGSTDEIGIFEMTSRGLREVENPSQYLLSERQAEAVGSVVTATLEGARPLLIEVQALTARSVFGYPRRTTNGFDLNRLQLLIAVLEKRANLRLWDQDVFVNVVGGLRLRDPGIDLAVGLAIASAVKSQPVAHHLCVFGEIGLSGEIRQVIDSRQRTQEARRLGYSVPNRFKTVREAIENFIK